MGHIESSPAFQANPDLLKKFKARRALVWTVVNTLFAASLWYGAVEGSEQARNVALVFVMAALVTEIVCAFLKIIHPNLPKIGRSVHPVIDISFDIVVVVFLVVVGWQYVAFAYLSCMMIDWLIRGDS